MPHRPSSRTRRRPLGVMLVAALLLLASSLAFDPVLPGESAPVASAQERSVTISPGAAKAGEVVTVRWSGFTPGAPVSIFQCVRNTPLQWKTSCGEPTWTAGVTGADGTGSAQYLVWQFTLQGLGTNPGFYCGGTDCAVVVTECDTELTSGLFASTPIELIDGGTNPVTDPEDLEATGLLAGAAAPDPGPDPAPPPLAAAAEPTRDITVEAGQAMDPVLPEIAEKVAEKDINLDSTVLNSPNAVEAFVGGRTDIALTATPLTSEQSAELDKAGRSSVMIPVAVSPQAVIHNMDVRDVPIQRFRMSVETAAKIWQGTIVGVDNPDMRADNGGCGITTSGPTTDRRILGFYRTGRASANYTFSNWLVEADGLWPPVQPGQERPDAPSTFFPTSDAGRSKNDNASLAKYIQTGEIPGGNTSGRLRLGFLDMSAVVELIKTSPPPTKPGLFPIRFVELRNAAGNWVTPNPTSVNATLAASPIGKNNVVAVNAAAPAPEAYPLVSVVYALVQKAPGGDYDAAKAGTGKEFIEYLLSDEGQEVLAEKGFVPLSGAIETQADAAAKSLSTSSTATTTTTPPDSDEFVLDAQEFGGGFSSDFGSDSFGSDSFGSDDLLSEGGDFSDGSGGEGSSGDGTGEDATGNSTISDSTSLLGSIAGAPALLAVLLLGVIAAVAGRVIHRVDRRKKATAAP